MYSFTEIYKYVYIAYVMCEADYWGQKSEK